MEVHEGFYSAGLQAQKPRSATSLRCDRFPALDADTVEN